MYKGKLLAAALGLFVGLSQQVDAGPRDQARRIHDRLTGVPPSDAMLDAMAAAITGNGGATTAALYAIDGAPGVAATGDFYTVKVKNWATPWTNEAQDVFAALNDYSATVVGFVRDDLDFRELLSADIIYRGAGGSLPAYSRDSNAHYESLEASGDNLGDPSVLVQDSQSGVTGFPPEATAGVMTTRAAARAFFVDGTNRAMLRFTLMNHLCTDLEQIKDASRPTDRIRQDVSRSPGGDSTLFLNQCVDCHSGMDPLAQAFAYYDFPYPDENAAPGLDLDGRKDLGSMSYTPGQVQPKYLINASAFANGYITDSDHWTNYWRLGINSGRIGWHNPAGNSGTIDLALNPAYSEGDGAASLGHELANTRAFSQCQVEKAFKAICLREPQASGSDPQAVANLVAGFESNHNMKQVFAGAAAYCSEGL